MKKYRTELIVLCFICTLFGAFVGELVGEQLKQREIENRALKLPDDVDCFTNRDIEFILFNEPKS